MVTYLNEQRVSSLSKAAVLAEEYHLTHKSAFTVPRAMNMELVCFCCHKVGHVIMDYAVLNAKKKRSS